MHIVHRKVKEDDEHAIEDNSGIAVVGVLFQLSTYNENTAFNRITETVQKILYKGHEILMQEFLNIFHFASFF